MVFECSALQHIRDEYPALFAGHHTMRSFMNQADQRSIIHFISACLDCSNDMVGAVEHSFGGPAVLDCLGIRTNAVSLVYALHAAVSPVDCWF